MRSFEDWPSEFDERELVYEGFYHLNSGIVACYHCHLRLYNFNTNQQDTVDVIHRQYSPNCELNNRDVCGVLPMWRQVYNVQP